MSRTRTVVVTGGTKGLGRAIVETFLAEGDTVWSLARSLPHDPEPNRNLHHLAADVRQRAQLDDAVATICRDAASIDVWINNAGYGKPVPFCDSDNTLWEDIFAVNFWGTVHGTRASLPALTRPGGSIINIASLAGLMSPRKHSAYATAKAAVIALTRANAVEFAHEGIRVNCIAPGPLDTEGFRAAGGDPARRARSIPTRQIVSPAEVARACLFFTDNMPSLTGHTLIVDGGSSAVGCYALQ